MPFVPVPKDLTKVKTKVALNLTKRQLVCFGLGGLVGIPTYIFSRGSIGNESAALLMIGLMLPFFAFGIYEKDGQPLEKMLKNFISVSFLRPPSRPYRTDNGYAALMRQSDYDKEVDEIADKTTGIAGKIPASRKEPVPAGQGRLKSHAPVAGQKADRA